MKTSLLRLVIFLVALTPLTLDAQTNIKAAFDAIINSHDATIMSCHTLDKDPETNVKTGQCDLYTFELPSSKSKLIKNVLDAFEKDSQKAFGLNSGMGTSTDNRIELAIGDATSRGLYINDPGYEYIYALFLAPKSEDPEGKYRYAYAFNYAENKGILYGKIAITYATTLKYRQQKELDRQAEAYQNMGGAIVMTAQTSWFDELMSCFQSMPSVSSQARISLATRAFNVIKETSEYSDVTQADKNAIREILKAMLSEKKYSETILNRLLNQCLVNIK